MKTKKYSQILLTVIAFLFIFSFQVNNSYGALIVNKDDEKTASGLISKQQFLDDLAIDFTPDDNQSATTYVAENRAIETPVEAAMAISPRAATIVTNGSQLTSILNQSSISGADYLLTEDITIDAASLVSTLTDVSDTDFLGALNNTGSPVTITVNNSNTGAAIRPFFGFFDNASFKNINLVFNDNVQSAVLVAKSSSNSVLQDSIITINGNVEESLSSVANNYIAVPLLNYVYEMTAQNIDLTVNGQVGSSSDTLPLTKGISSAGFLAHAGGVNTFQTIDVTITGGIYAYGNRGNVGAGGFAFTLSSTDDTSLYEAINVTIGTADTPANIIAKHIGEPTTEQTTVAAGFASNIEFYGFGTGDHTLTFNHNTVTVHGDIIYDMRTATGSPFVNVATGFGKISTIYTAGKSMLDFKNNAVTVDGKIQATGYAHTVSSGCMTFLSSRIEGAMTNNTVQTGPLKAEAVMSTPITGYDKRASAMGFSYGNATKVSMTNNEVIVNGNVEAISEIDTNTQAYATGFGFSNSDMLNNDTTVLGDIISEVKNATSPSSTAFSSGLSIVSNNTVESDIYVTGNIIAKSSQNAFATGLAANEGSQSERNKVEVYGNIEADSSGTGWVSAAGYADTIANGAIKNNSVHVEHNIEAKGAKTVSASGFINSVEKASGNTPIYIEENIMRTEGQITAQTLSATATDYALSSGFIAQVGNGVTVKNNGAYAEQGITAEAPNGGQKSLGYFVAQATFANGGTDPSTIMHNSLLTRQTNDSAEHYYSFIDGYEDSALPSISENFVTFIKGKSRTAYGLENDSGNHRWDLSATRSTPLGQIRIENTSQVGPAFDYVLDSNLGDLEMLLTHDTAAIAADITHFPVNVTTDLDKVPHEAVDDALGNAKVIYDIMGIQDPMTAYQVKINPKEHVSVTVSKSIANQGDTVNVAYTLDSDYELDSLSVVNDTDGSIIAFNAATSLFTMPESDVTVTAIAKKTGGKGDKLYLPDKTVYVGDIFTLTPNRDLQTGSKGWAWDKTYLSATFNSPATFTALKVGITFVNYTLETGETAVSKVTILDINDPNNPNNTGNTSSTNLPSTGGYSLLLASSLILLIGGLAIGFARKS